MKNQILHEALMSFPLEKTGGRYTFLHRLCRENSWSNAEGIRAIGEYRRFVYLAAISPTPVTPPPAVDQVWHLHLLYTRSYWDGLCQGVLGRPLHHGPTAGGREEVEKFGNWYEKTRSLYRDEFGASPPAGLWPTCFSAETRYRWTDSARHWVIAKPRFGGILPGVFPLLLGYEAVPLLVVAVLGFVVWVIRKIIEADQPEKKKRGDGGGDFGGISCSAGGSDCGDSGGGDCGGGDGGGGCGGGGCGGGD